MSNRRWMSWKIWKPGTAIALGVATGVVLGTVLDNMGVWLSLGVVFGALGEGAISKNGPSR